MSDQTLLFQYSKEKERRLDKFLADNLSDYSRSRIQNWIRDGYVLVDGRPVTKTGYNLDEPARVEVHIPPVKPSNLEPEEIPLDVVFENDDLLVVNKPAGMVVHPAAGHATGTLVHAALAHAPEMEGVGGEHRPGVVHRLDKDTSGLILMAKNERAHRWLQDQFRLRKAQKTYLALVDGAPPTSTGRIEAPIGRDPKARKRMAVVPGEKGRRAVSTYRVVERFPQHTLLEVHPETGRTHQIRLHLAFIGSPVAGDRTYGRRHSTIPVERHFLHAAHLSIRLPGEEQATSFEAPLPDELEYVLAELRRER